MFLKKDFTTYNFILTKAEKKKNYNKTYTIVKY